MSAAARDRAVRVLGWAREGGVGLGDRGCRSAQRARDWVANDIARDCADGRFPDPDDVEAYRLLSDLAERAVRYVEARVDARYGLRRA